jgi:hypothetical protein
MELILLGPGLGVLASTAEAIPFPDTYNLLHISTVVYKYGTILTVNYGPWR